MPLAEFLARLGHEPVRRSGNELWYLASYRGERTFSFRVNVAKQLWYDSVSYTHLDVYKRQVFEIDSIKENRELFPVVTIIIMEAFINKMRCV